MRFSTATKDIDSLALSIKMNGLLCPPSATIKGSKYVLVFGHRRLEAVKQLKMKSFKSEWRSRINIRQGKKEEKLVVSFKNRYELKDLLSRLSRIL